MKFLKTNYFSIIAIITIFLINIIVSRNIDIATAEKLKGINGLIILKQSLIIPAVFFLMNIFSKKILTNKQLVLFFFLLIIIESTVRFFKHKYLIDTNFLLGMLMGLSSTILLNLFMKKYNFSGE